MIVRGVSVPDAIALDAVKARHIRGDVMPLVKQAVNNLPATVTMEGDEFTHFVDPRLLAKV